MIIGVTVGLGLAAIACPTNVPGVDGAIVFALHDTRRAVNIAGGCQGQGCNGNSRIVDGAAMAWRRGRQVAEGGEGAIDIAVGCDEYGCHDNSPIVDGAAIAWRRLPLALIHCQAGPCPMNFPIVVGVIIAALHDVRLATVTVGCDEYGCNDNSPIVDGAAITPRLAHQAIRE